MICERGVSSAIALLAAVLPSPESALSMIRIGEKAAMS